MKSIHDSIQYEAKAREFSVAWVIPKHIRVMQARLAPLGFMEDQWNICLTELRHALIESDLLDADVRIRGSSTRFFSGCHKPFPKSYTGCLEEAGKCRSRCSEDELLEYWQLSGYDGDSNLPSRHYWDSRYRLGLSRHPSDYDIQISSNTLAQRMSAYMTDAVISRHGGHFKHDFVVQEFPPLGEWAENWAVRTGRDVNIASFKGQGPEGPSAFHTDDWVIMSLAKER